MHEVLLLFSWIESQHETQADCFNGNPQITGLSCLGEKKRSQL